MEFDLYLIVAVTISFVSVQSSTPSPTASVNLTKLYMETSTGASDPSPATQEVTSLTSYRSMSHPTPTVTNRSPNQTSTVNPPPVTTDIKSSPTAADNVNVTSMSSNIRGSTFSVHDTTSNAFKSSAVKSSNAESMSQTSYSANMVSRSSPTETKAESVNIATASIQATGTTKVTSMQSSIIANDSVDTGMSSLNMINQTSAMTFAAQTKVSSIKSTSIVGTTNVRSSVVIVTESTHTSKSSVLVQDTVSPLVVDSSSLGRPSSIRGITSVDQNTTASSEVATQAGSKAIKTLITSIYLNVSSTVKSSKPPKAVQPSTSPMIQPTTTSRSSTQSIALKMTTIPNSASPIGVSSSSAIYVTASTSTDLINATTAIGRNMTTSQMIVNNTTLSVMSTTGSSLRNSTTAPSMGISVSPTSNLTTQSDSMPIILNRNKTSLTRNTTITSTTEMRSSLSVVQNTTTQPVVLQSTISPVISVNRSSTMNGTIMASKVGSIDATMSILNVTRRLVMANGTAGMSSIRKTNIQSYRTVNSNNNTTIPFTQIMTISSASSFTKPLITVNASASSMVMTSSVIVKNASMTSVVMNATRSSVVTNTTSSATSNVIVNKTMPPMMNITMSPVIPSTMSPVIPNVASQSLNVNISMKMTNMVNPTISIMTNITTSSPLINGTISSGNVTTLSVSRNILTSGLIVSATINASETLSNFVQSMSQVRVNLSTLPVFDTASTSILPTNNNTTFSAEVIKTMSPTVSNLSTMHISSLVENMTSSIKSVSHSQTILSMSYSSRFPVTTPITQSVFVRITINAACTEAILTSDTFKSAVRSACRAVLDILPKYIIIKKVTCGSVIVDMEIKNVNSDSVIDKLNKAAENKTLTISYDGKNLTVASVTKTPTTTSSDSDDNKVLIIYIVFGAVLGLAFLIGIIALIVRCHRERSTGMFHLPSEENLELSGFSGRTKSNYQGGNFYGELQPDSSQHRLSGIPNESDPVADDLAGSTENGGSFGGAYLPAWESLPTIDMSEVSRKDEESSEMNDNLLLTYNKKSDDDRRDSDKRQGFVASFDNVGAV